MCRKVVETYCMANNRSLKDLSYQDHKNIDRIEFTELRLKRLIISSVLTIICMPFLLLIQKSLGEAILVSHLLFLIFYTFYCIKHSS